jgi:hypothetical protein
MGRDPRPDGRSPRRWLCLAAVVVLLWSAAPVAGQAPALQVVPVSTQLWVGTNDLILQLFDEHSVPIVDAGAQPTVTLVAPDGTTREPVAGAVRRFAASARDLVVAQVDLDEVGPWRVVVTAALADGTRTGTADLMVLPDDGVPALGAPVPSVVTATMRDAHNLMRAITSDPEPVSQFYTSSVSELLQAGQAFVLVFDSYLFRPNEACGGALGILHEISSEFPSLNVVHAEPWVTSFQTGTLALEPPDGPARLTDAATAFGLREPPWVFVVDGAGLLRAKFRGVVGTDELRAAMARVGAG